MDTKRSRPARRRAALGDAVSRDRLHLAPVQRPRPADGLHLAASRRDGRRVHAAADARMADAGRRVPGRAARAERHRTGQPNAVLFTVDEVGAAALAVWLVQRVRFSLEGLYFLRSVILAGLIAGVVGATAARPDTVVKGAPFFDVVGVGRVRFRRRAAGHAGARASWSRFRAHRSGDHERFDLVLGMVSFVLVVGVALVIFDGDTSRKFGTGAGFALTYIPLFLTVAVTLLLGGRARNRRCWCSR